MESYSTRLLALIFALVITTRASESQAQPTGLAESARPTLPEVTRAKSEGEPLLDEAPSSEQQLAWDCVPSYWWGYWTWAWQPCAWIDRSYVEGTIGAIAEAPQTENTKELTQSHL